MCPSGYGHAIRRDCQRLENVGQEDVLCEGALCEGALCEGALRKVHPSRFAGGFSKTPWTHPWGLSHKIPLVRVSKSLLRSAFVAGRISFFSKSSFPYIVKKNAITSPLPVPYRKSGQQASQEGPCEAVPRDGFTTFADHSSYAARGRPYEAAVPNDPALCSGPPCAVARRLYSSHNEASKEVTYAIYGRVYG